MSDLARHLKGFAGKRVLVIGDMVSDQYIVGTPARISREAPVIVLHHREEFTRPGGAANLASNLAALGAKTCVAGVIGEDPSGHALSDSLTALGIDTSGLVRTAGRATATKMRIVGGGEQQVVQQQIVRIDKFVGSFIDAEPEGKLIAVIEAAIDAIDAVVISDYENGVISPPLIAATLAAARRRDILIAVDSHGDLFRFKGVTLATPNQPEAETTVGHVFDSEEALEAAGEEIRAGMRAQAVLLTRGSHGMSLFEDAKAPVHLTPTNLREVFDPSGAGDTACAVFTLAVLAGAPMVDAAALANLAAGEVVKKLGVATIASAELGAVAERGGR